MIEPTIDTVVIVIIMMLIVTVVIVTVVTVVLLLLLLLTVILIERRHIFGIPQGHLMRKSSRGGTDAGTPHAQHVGALFCRHDPIVITVVTVVVVTTFPLQL